jgi:hypothetical protein
MWKAKFIANKELGRKRELGEKRNIDGSREFNLVWLVAVHSQT